MRHLTRWRAFMVVYVLAHAIAAALTSLMAVASLAVIEACALSWIFVVCYARVPGWHKSRAGVQMMSLGVFIALLTTVSLIPDELSRAWIEYAAAAILVAMAAIMLNLVRLLRLARTERGDPR